MEVICRTRPNASGCMFLSWLNSESLSPYLRYQCLWILESDFEGDALLDWEPVYLMCQWTGSHCIFSKVQCYVELFRQAVAYLGFHKGATFSLATSVHTKGGQTMFSNFFPKVKKFFLPKGALAQWPPPKYATAD